MTTTATITTTTTTSGVTGLVVGQLVWFDGEGYREIASTKFYVCRPQYRDGITLPSETPFGRRYVITFTDGHTLNVSARARFVVWDDGPRPMA